MAFVPDIKGVWSMEGTFEMTSKPTNIARMKINRILVSINVRPGLRINFSFTILAAMRD